MRMILFSVLSLMLSAPAVAAFAEPATSAADPLVMPDTPSGEGDPNTMVCRAPQPIAGTAQLGPKLCGYNFEWSQFRMHGRDLAPDGFTVIDRPMVSNPKGRGNPDAVTCRKPVGMAGPSLHIPHAGPEVCLTNHIWAALAKNHLAIDAKGVVVTEQQWMPSTAATFSYSDPLQGYRAP